ncbi:hypothetical protein WI58_23960 [Burkholderia cepacia]|nr:hypothetical protein WI47_35530 [Burkholderia cepacia]KVA68205.1 hypothetical protein WI48_32850 [Burkholderia cepacia]KVA70881.1 hypothetical protein WI49_35100 [Burkholderia cepacia]KVA82664.1 hypothetical protein WI50_21650 [Burkholderia cepacia]KVA83004.1 hypothetical protein WI52_18065 [Burkholderia cepacia]
MTAEMRQRARQTIDLTSKRLAACQDVTALAGYSGAELADYVANLPDSECANAFFSMPQNLALLIDRPVNISAVADRFVNEANAYASANGALLNLTLYLRAAYYLSMGGTIPNISPDILAELRPSLMQLIAGPVLFTPNKAASTTAGEVLTLITNMHDEAHYLDAVKQRVAGFTNSRTAPNVASSLDDPNIGYGFTGILKIFFYAHYRPDAIALIENDPSYATTLYKFSHDNKAALLNDSASSYQLNQAAAEAFRFAMHPALLPTVGGFIKDALMTSTMTGQDRLIWLAAAEAVEFYDNTNCRSYGTCNFEVPLAAAILTKHYPCANSVVKLRAEELTPDQAQAACSLLDRETPYFHAMLRTGKVPVANDHNTTLEVVVFSNNTEYQNYSGVFFGNDTDNGGIYLEGDPSSPTNQARFIAYEADWLRPTFEIWNLKHEYVHYLDGRFDMYGDFNYENQVPVVWYLEGLAEYISRENDDQDAIDAASTGQYRLSEIFKNTYAMDDYVNRAYSWGYMAVRFVFERHPEVLTTILPKFRVGDYAGYWSYMQQLSTQFDDEFAQWVPTVTTSGTPLPPPKRTIVSGEQSPRVVYVARRHDQTASG